MTSLSSVPRMDQSEGLLPAFSSRPYTHLPTPQSPNNIARYVVDTSHTPQSPLPNAPQYSNTPSSYHMLTAQDKSNEETPTRSHESKQCATPELSPTHNMRGTPSLHAGLQSSPSVRSNKTDTSAISTKLGKPLLALENIASTSSALAPSPHISSPVSAVSENSSRFSSPFINKLSAAIERERFAKGKQTESAPPSPVPMAVDDDPFSSPPDSFSSRRRHGGVSSNSATTVSGGEIERIRQALIEDRLAQIQEAEIRRPDYLKRTKRQLSEVESDILADHADQERGNAVGIMESPNQGRRLKLFQETSEESFEESLMAGGYGRYRTNDWVRQPQPLSFLGSNSTSKPNAAEMLVEHVEEAPTSEKELKKRRRLDAFRSSVKYKARLAPVELVDKGRVLLEVPSEDRSSVPQTPESSPSKRRGTGGKRKRKVADSPLGKDKKQSVEELQGPNWPDNEFPWKLRKEEHHEAEKVREDERIKWIEKFLDRDTDDEDEDENTPQVTFTNDEEILPSAKWGLVYEDEADRPLPARMGRGKMVPLLAHPDDPRRAYVKKKSIFPSDPADARAALLARKSVRALGYRNQRRKREATAEEDEDAVICICNGKDDGRELVQCDGCQTWYHLQCIGIRNVVELGREEDVWFCRSCVTRSRSPSPVDASHPSILHEPIFVPTDDAPRILRTQDPTLYQPLHNSPLWNPPRVPKTPPAREGARHSDFDISSSSESSKLPSTPQNPPHDIRLYNTPVPFERYPGPTNEDPPFDPHSTPSRGIKFGAFATPKSNPWSIRAGGLFNTPSRHHSRASYGRSFGSLEDMGASFGAFDGLTRYPNVEDSPIGRPMAGERLKKLPQSPLLPKPLLPSRAAAPVPEESPVVRLRPQ
ncbi:hypothetical protein AGABI1DRAFT_116896 [Agaricus bisporus var. burnettii JB137-S8]|uniref:PHD-type domain-containing protein n=1 Tax=Agaricus bisporus var. burnettii (strain JB137-S8 / ATCC MYA-4627 / FGSC 10392) TaxID=597362 RepID=K5Y5I8_AGABU|nr:uncharacterized protein AGABI1DRAFT_116896 [Agaricus bisporus var. burnettii JB137-S8]EKM83375.1 hypothetical protein AGABI1DRAFT_116896 [Agaricus bisporus var. burnettii JB137-S8]